MPKAPSPVRLQDELMQAASLTAKRMHRSTAEQIEYWASLGRQISRYVDPDTLLEVAAGVATLKVEPALSTPIDPDTVFTAVEADHLANRLEERVSPASLRYQASTTHPGYLEQIDSKGNRTIGSFSNGEFTTLKGGTLE